LTSTAPASPSAAQTATGVITVTNGNLSTIPNSPATTAAMGAYPALPGSFQHGYFEARIQINPKGAIGNNTWPAFWSFGTSSVANGSVWSQTGLTAENDFIEFLLSTFTQASTTYYYWAGNTMHNWQHGSNTNTGTDLSNTNWPVNGEGALVGTTQSPQVLISDGNWHTYGCLWVSTSSTTGYVEYYLDNYLILHNASASGSATISRYLTGIGTGTSSGATDATGAIYTAPGAGLAAQELEHMYLIIGGGGNSWPINVDWVHVWQK
jgi:hypothetical protein